MLPKESKKSKTSNYKYILLNFNHIKILIKIFLLLKTLFYILFKTKNILFHFSIYADILK